MGPSWYWMPEVIEEHFNLFGYTTSDFYDLTRLDPSYTVFWKDEDPLQVPADITELYPWLESKESGSSNRLDSFLQQAKVKYQLGIHDLARKPMQKISDYFDKQLLFQLFQLDIFKSLHKHLQQYFSHPKIIALLSFPVLFLGGTAKQIPALYSLMNYADLVLGTWYPMGGMYQLSKAWHKIGTELGVKFHFN